MVTKPASERWWYEGRFAVNWSSGKDCRHVELLLAHEIMSPVLQKYRRKLKFWRVHRIPRIVKNNKTPAFIPFKYYTILDFTFCFWEEVTDEKTEEIKNAISDELGGNDLLKKLENGDYVKYEKVQKTSKPDDCTWPDEIRKSWLYFITGASDMWLALIGEVVANFKQKGKPYSFSDYKVCCKFYEEVNQYMKNVWCKYGSHSMFHHLSALFGYEFLEARAEVKGVKGKNELLTFLAKF